MMSNNGVPAPVHSASGPPVPRTFATAARRASCGWARLHPYRAVALVGCSLSDGVGSFIVDPSRYSAYHCNALVSRLSEQLEQQNDLRDLMDKASEGGGGSVIGTLSYRADYEKALGDEKLLRRTAAEKKCALPPPAPSAPTASAVPRPSSTPTSFQSDQTIR